MSREDKFELSFSVCLGHSSAFSSSSHPHQSSQKLDLTGLSSSSSRNIYLYRFQHRIFSLFKNSTAEEIR
jgi:hypothetical protein